MTSIAYSPVTIQTSSRSAPSVPTWFGEMVVVAHYLTRNQGLAMVNEQVRLVRGRFGHYEVIDFFAVLLGYAFSGEPTLEAFFTHVRPFAPAFMALFGRDRLPHRSTLSRFLADVDLSCIEELRQLFLQDLLARPGTTDGMGGLWDRQGQRWLVFDIDGTRQTARQRPLPQTGDLPPARRRLRSVCAPGYVGRKRGEMVCTRTAVLQAHTHQWLGTFAGAGNGDYRGDLRRAVEAIGAYLSARHVPFAHGVVRLDGQYGNAAIVEELAGKGLGWVMRGRDYHLLDVPQVRARLRKPADQHTTHPETQTRRDLFDCPEIPFTVDGRRMRVIVATHPAAAAPSPIGVTRDGVVHELFFTSLPLDAFTPADVVALYLHRGAFETVLCDEDEEQDPDRWCSHTPHGQAFWHILSQWAWNLRQELGHHLHPTAMRQTEFAPAQPEGSSLAATTPPPICYGPPQWASLARIGTFAGQDFTLQSDGSLRCPAGQPLYPQERRLEHNGTLRVLYAAGVRSCRACPLRERCLGHGASSKKPRRVSAVLHPLPLMPPLEVLTLAPPATQPLVWGDWGRRRPRREWMRLVREQRVDILMEPPPADKAVVHQLWTRAQRAHWRLSWSMRLAHNARSPAAVCVAITVFGLPSAFAAFLALPVV